MHNQSALGDFITGYPPKIRLHSSVAINRFLMWNSRRRSSGLATTWRGISLVELSRYSSKGMPYVMRTTRPMSADLASELNSVIFLCFLLTTRGRVAVLCSQYSYDISSLTSATRF
jgi:hypothetical protein